ncbi:MAG: hypothetical protein PUD67_08530 [Prevotellaceae bacterium]|nr:hypothetical protein [Prevotellaceae bacterium]
MKETKIYLSAQQLLEYVEKNEVAWEEFDSLIEFTRAEDYVFAENEKEGYNMRNNEMLEIIRGSKECVVFDSNADDPSGFEDLVNWSEGKDLLVLVDNTLMLCIAPCDKEQVMAMVA